MFEDKYYRCRNISEDPENSFLMAPRDVAYILENAGIKYIVHSHCDVPAIPSDTDHRIMSFFVYDWIIYSCTKDTIIDKRKYDRTGKEI